MWYHTNKRAWGGQYDFKRAAECSYRKYTVSEIINAVIRAEFNFQRFDEHPSWTNPNIPGEFTMIAYKEKI